MGTRAVAVICCVLVLAGCGTSGDPIGAGAGADPQRREWAVAGDPEATAAEIVTAGRIAGIARTSDRLLITYVVQSDDDEGPQQGAWRLYDEHGDRLADDTLGTVTEQGAFATPTATEDGFLLENYTEPTLLRIAEDGDVVPVPHAGARSRTGPGDLLVERPSDEGWWVYHPRTGSTTVLPPLPTGNPQSVVLDGTGAVRVLLPWGQEGGARVASSAGGTGPWRTETLPLAPGSYPVLGLGVTGDLVTLFSAHGTDEYPVIDGLWQRATTAAGTWTRVGLNDVRLSGTLQPRVQGLPDGRLLITGDEGPGRLQDGRGWREVAVPGGDASGLQVAGSDWYLLRPELRLSRDEGESWQQVRR